MPVALAVLLLAPAAPVSLTGPFPAAYEAWLRARVETADRAFGGPPCADFTVEQLATRGLRPAERAGPPHVQRSRRPVYLHQVRLTGCGRAVVHNLQVIRSGPRAWEAIALLPGGSRASPKLQTDAMQAVASVALNGAPRLPCKASEALKSWTNGEVEVLEPGITRWRERWPMRMCGVDRSLEVQFDRLHSGEIRRVSVSPAWR